MIAKFSYARSFVEPLKIFRKVHEGDGWIRIRSNIFYHRSGSRSKCCRVNQKILIQVQANTNFSNKMSSDCNSGKLGIDLGKKEQTFVSKTNPMTGKTDWVIQEEQYDYIQEIARSGYGDMLHDEDRNKKYFEAIRKVVKSLKAQGKQVKALDIGTGTGLLSMMAATAGADAITACEAFLPMAACADQVIEANRFSSVISLVPKLSTDVLLGTDMPERANLLVTELFDTELIGEGAIGAYTDAHRRLMQEDCLAVPSVGIVYVQAVQCSLLKKWNTLQPLQLPNGTTINVPLAFSYCGGAPSLHDLQVDELRDHLKLISKPVEVFRFDFTKRDALKTFESTMKEVLVTQDGDVDAFVMWWDLEMDPQGEIILSCAPCWTRPKPIPWRDHWMQALYYPSVSQPARKGESINIHSCHDEYSLWFDTVKPSSRSRLGQMNDEKRNSVFTKTLQKHICPSTVCLVISDGSLLPLMAAALGARKVFYLDNNQSCRKIIKQVIEANNLQDVIVVLEKSAEDIEAEDFLNLKIDLVVAEPYFQAAHLPWENLYFWYCMSSLRRFFGPSVVMLPLSMTINAVALQFRDLHKIRAPVGHCEGFNITAFDKLISDSSDVADEEIEPQPLWEYPSTALSQPVPLIKVDFTTPVDDFSSPQQKTELICSRSGLMNGIAFWTDFDFGDGLVVSNGYDGTNDRWDLFTRQGVKLFRTGKDMNPSDKIQVLSTFSSSVGEFSFSIT